jgi:predicted MPP superfamily phosphohydrolase
MINCLEEMTLAERLKPRIAVEQHFARIGRTNRHGRFERVVERRIAMPLLKLGLQSAGVYSRGVRNALTPVVRVLPLRFPNLPPAFEGFQVLHLSDFHIDCSPDLAEVLGKTLRQLRPDLCLMTGDYRYEDYGPCEQVYPLMRHVNSSISARHGIFGVLGNHDHAEIAFGLEEMGVRMLVNQAVPVSCEGDSIWICGVDDPFDYQCDDLPGTLSQTPAGSFKILLAHCPELYREAADSGVALYLTGHTHAGQIRFPGLGALRHNAKCPRSFAYGHWKYRQMHGYTSAGLGCSSLPIRFNCPPEAVLIELRRG